jgi:hypothetical protein
VYATSLRLFPAEFRQRYADEVQMVFTNDCLDGYCAGGWLGLVGLWLRTVPDILRGACGEHWDAWVAEHPGSKRNVTQQALVCGALMLCVLAIFLADMHTPPEVPLAVLYACVLFGAGALLRPLLALLTCAATVGVYVGDGFAASSGWTPYHLVGLLPILIGGLWALFTGAQHARLQARGAAATT